MLNDFESDKPSHQFFAKLENAQIKLALFFCKELLVLKYQCFNPFKSALCPMEIWPMKLNIPATNDSELIG